MRIAVIVIAVVCVAVLLALTGIGADLWDIAVALDERIGEWRAIVRNEG
jgi:hypothetical protein